MSERKKTKRKSLENPAYISVLSGPQWIIPSPKGPSTLIQGYLPPKVVKALIRGDQLQGTPINLNGRMVNPINTCKDESLQKVPKVLGFQYIPVRSTYLLYPTLSHKKCLYR